MFLKRKASERGVGPTPQLNRDPNRPSLSFTCFLAFMYAWFWPKVKHNVLGSFGAHLLLPFCLLPPTPRDTGMPGCEVTAPLHLRSAAALGGGRNSQDWRS